MAIFFGTISPKIRITTVRIPVAIPTESLIFIATIVIRDDAVRFTMLLPIRIALSILPYLSSMSIAVCACLFPSSARALSLTLFTVVRAVSAEEKKADKNTRISNENNCMTPSVSKTKITPCLYITVS